MGDSRYEFFRFKDLKANGIVHSRHDLHVKIKRHNFPKPLKDGDAKQSAAFWRKSTVHAWLDRAYPHGQAFRRRVATGSTEQTGEVAS